MDGWMDGLYSSVFNSPEINTLTSWHSSGQTSMVYATVIYRQKAATLIAKPWLKIRKCGFYSATTIPWLLLRSGVRMEKGIWIWTLSVNSQAIKCIIMKCTNTYTLYLYYLYIFLGRATCYCMYFDNNIWKSCTG